MKKPTQVKLKFNLKEHKIVSTNYWQTAFNTSKGVGALIFFDDIFHVLVPNGKFHELFKSLRQEFIYIAKDETIKETLIYDIGISDYTDVYNLPVIPCGPKKYLKALRRGGKYRMVSYGKKGKGFERISAVDINFFSCADDFSLEPYR